MDQNLSELKRRASMGDIEAGRQYNLALIRSGKGGKPRISRDYSELRKLGYELMCGDKEITCEDINCGVCRYIPQGRPRIHRVLFYSWTNVKLNATCTHQHAKRRQARDCAHRHAYAQEMKKIYGVH